METCDRLAVYAIRVFVASWGKANYPACCCLLVFYPVPAVLCSSAVYCSTLHHGSYSSSSLSSSSYPASPSTHSSSTVRAHHERSLQKSLQTHSFFSYTRVTHIRTLYYNNSVIIRCYSYGQPPHLRRTDRCCCTWYIQTRTVYITQVIVSHHAKIHLGLGTQGAAVIASVGYRVLPATNRPLINGQR